jgi:hypothetical protein
LDQKSETWPLGFVSKLPKDRFAIVDDDLLLPVSAISDNDLNKLRRARSQNGRDLALDHPEISRTWTN